MYSISSSYKNILATKISIDSDHLIINDIDEFPISSVVVVNNVVTVTVTMEEYINPNITSLKLYTSADLLIVNAIVSTSISTSSYSNQYKFTFTIA